MQTINFDLVIVGAGPAGCTTALNLAGSGLRVALVDKSVLPADKTCGDALSGTVLKVLKRLPGNCFDEFLKLEPQRIHHGEYVLSPPAWSRWMFPSSLKRKLKPLPPAISVKDSYLMGFSNKRSGI